MSKATRQRTKEHNIRLVLRTIYNQDETSRAEISRATKLTKTTVSNIVAGLIQDGLVTETGIGTSNGGKPPILIRVVDDARHFIGLDLANSEFRGATVNMRGDIIHRHKLRVSGYERETALALVYTLIDKLLAVSDKPISGIGIGAPGLIDPEHGVIRRSVNLDWQNLPLRQLIKERYSLPCYITNDCQAAALGEYTFGRNIDGSNLVVVKIGRGIGAGIVLNGQLYYGDGYSSGEIGHLVVKDHGEPCACGNRGCLETVASTQAMVKQARKRFLNNPKSKLHRFVDTEEAINTDILLKAFEANDVELHKTIQKVGEYLGIALASFVTVLNAQNIIIAGSITRFGDGLLSPIKDTMQKYSMSYLANETEVNFSSLGQDIVIKGATSLLLANELNLV
jgi:glucokinase-like ROK family protein